MQKFLLVFFFLLILAQTNAKGAPEILITNNTSESINITFTFLKNNSYLLKDSIIKQAGETYYAKDRRYIINNNYFIEFVDTHTECSWLHTLGLRHANGWGIKLKINGTEVVTICANKYNALDHRNHAELAYHKDSNSNETFIFKNIGWWQQSSTYPIGKEINLAQFKKHYTPMQMDWFIYNGD